MRSILLAFLIAAGLEAQSGIRAPYYTLEVANCSSTGTTKNKLAKLSSGCAVITGAGDTSGAVGVVVDGAGTTGTAIIAFAGRVPLIVDASSTIGHYIQQSASVTGDGADTGSSTAPTSNQIIGTVAIASSGAASTSFIDLTLQTLASGGGGSGSTLLDWQKGEASSFAANATDQIVATTTISSIPAGKCVNAYASFWLLTGSSSFTTLKWNLGGTGSAHSTISGGTAVSSAGFAGLTNYVINSTARVCNDPGVQNSQQITIAPVACSESVCARGEDGTAAVDTSIPQQLSITVNISSAFNLQKRAYQIELLQ